MAHGATATLPEAPTKEGYTFAGWYVGEVAYDFTTAVTADVTVKAAWALNSYTVTFDTDGGSAVDAQTVAHGATAEAPAEPIKVGYAFIGWTLNGEAYDFATPVTADITLTATYELNMPDLSALAGTWTGKEQYMTVNYSYEFVITADGITAIYYNGSTDVTMVINYVLFEDGVLTINYSAASNEGVDMVFTVSDGNGIMTAPAGALAQQLVMKKQYTVIFEWGNYEGSGSNNPTEKTVSHGDTVSAASKSWTGHEIEGWYLDGVLFDFEAPITGNITLVANWKLKTHTVTYYKEDGTVLKEVLVNYGESVPAEEAPTTGMVVTEGASFNGFWYSTAKGNVVNDVINKSVTSDKNCYPGIIYPMNDIEGTWIGTDSKGAWSIVIDAAQNTVTATLSDAEITVNWFRYQTLDGVLKFVVNYTAPSSTSATSLSFTYNEETGTMATGTSSSALVIQKAGNPTVTFNPDNGDAATSVSVSSGEAVEAPADPIRVGYAFLGWTLNGEAYDFATPVTSDITLVASWMEVTTYTVTVNLNGGSLSGVQSTYYVAGGEVFSELSALGEPTQRNYTFLGWTLNGEAYDFSVPVTSDITLVASWKGVDKLLKIYKQDGSIYKEVPVEYGKTFAQVISKELTGVESDTVSADALAALAAELMTVEGSYYSGDWFTSGNGSTYFDFTATVTANKNMYANFIAPVEPSLEGSWTCVYSGKTYVITLNLEKDASGNIIGATATVSVDGGAASDAEIIRTYIKDGQLPQFIIKAGGKTYTIKQVEVDGAIVWQYSSQTLTAVV